MRNLAVKQNYTLEEYAELEKSSEERLEYFDGNVWSMAGASPTHEEIVINTATELKNKLRGKNCRVFGSNLRVKVPIYKPYRYPDVTALCEQPIYEDFYGLKMLINPNLIVEVLSDSTEAFDESDKFTYYKSIESFTEYLLISQNRPHVALFTKQDETVWLHREYNSLDESVYLSSLDCEISLAEIYSNIEFPEVEHPRFPFEREDFR
ncbi:MAG TPA: Uma2 family endonuclease [Pyrinomonadaceae bacterium]|nr:Uma2 family endonuclease [Pyrinomonadaceae bacterium]